MSHNPTLCEALAVLAVTNKLGSADTDTINAAIQAVIEGGERGDYADQSAELLRNSALFMRTQLQPGEYNSLADRIDSFLTPVERPQLNSAVEVIDPAPQGSSRAAETWAVVTETGLCFYRNESVARNFAAQFFGGARVVHLVEATESLPASKEPAEWERFCELCSNQATHFEMKRHGRCDKHASSLAVRQAPEETK